MGDRTTIVLDDESRRAAEELAEAHHTSLSAVIRQALVRQRDLELGVSDASRSRRRAALERLFELFEDHDPDAEIEELKRQDEGF